MATEAQILDSLRVILDPDLGKDIVSLGFVKNLKIEGAKVSFSLELTTPACPVRDEFKERAEKAAGAVAGVGEVVVTMSSAQAAPRDAQAGGLRGVKQIIAVASCKGGVGKSTVAALLALDLARRGHLTGLLDADIFGPSLPTLFNVHHPELFMTDEKRLLPHEGPAGLRLMSFGFLLGDQPAILRGPMVTGYLQQLIQQVEWGPLDYLVLDLPPGTGDVQLTLTQSLRISGAVIVTTHQSLSLVDVSRGILMFEKVNVPILGLVENMAYVVCPKCSEKHWLFGKPASELQRRFGLQTLAEFPIEPAFSGPFSEAPDLPVVRAAVDNIIRALGRRSLEASALPTIENAGAQILMTWNDQTVSRVDPFRLRASCECAHCVDERTGKRLLKEAEIPVDIRAEEITPLGNYAVSIKWSDKHSTGIHPYPRIRELFPPESLSAKKS
jgi:Mrp family chromosome partitioning ATPase/DUF971 family protein